MIGHRSNSLFSNGTILIIIIVEFCSDLATVDGLGRLAKKKVNLVNDDQLLSLGRTYSLEDFFWTGSGDGPLPPADSPGHNTIIKTTTILATVFLDSPSAMPTETVNKDEDCLTECPISPPSGEIDPTRVGEDDSEDKRIDASLPDPRYWLLTVLRAPAAPLPPALSRSLARLYQRAFLRQQERHLGIVTTSAVSLRKKHHTDSDDTVINNTSISLSIQQNKFIENEFLNHTNNFDNHLNVNSSEEIKDIKENSNVTRSIKYLNHTYSLEFTPDILNISQNVRQKRSAKSIAQELNIILMKNYSFDDVKDLSNVLDVVKREVYGEVGQPMVEVFLYNLTRDNISGINDEVKIIYWVSVGGRPVPARTAARDMHLLADSEVVAELGYPITTKAEPYLKSPQPLNGVLHAYNMRDTWLIIGGSIVAAIILLSLVALLACRLVNRRKSSAASRILQSEKMNIDGKRMSHQIDISKGKDNVAYLHEEKDKKIFTSSDKKKSEERYVTHVGDYEQRKFSSQRLSSAGSTSSSSSTETSQMTITLRQRQRLFEQQMQNEYATVNKKNKSKHKKIRSKKVGIANETATLEDSSSVNKSKLNRFVLSSPSSHSSSSCDSVIIRRPQGVVSPTSYLSMPSVKSFPRGNAVEPLSRVLEPLSVRHLDMDSDSPVQASRRKVYDGSKGVSASMDSKVKSSENSEKSNVKDDENISTNLVRLGSINRDPGVVGPMVWDLHRRKLDKVFISDSQISDDVSSGGGNNISKMRQRFSELVDDAFSLFGSGNTSPKSKNLNASVNININNSERLPIPGDASNIYRRHSAKDGTKYNSKDPSKQYDRPQTALPPRPPLPRQSISPTLAWSSNDNTSMKRATSASGVRRPIIDVALVNSDAVLSPDDPAIPLIQAIKKELEKLPGTSDA
ncbi:uncharacterized protein LOC143909287 [Arctopsyche grandis]|uniref:uncharacterized protein LOC143909287 n=1 Tax=Arctopsyche grandis TaxID=121162 RepID=UPI00406D7964